MVRAGRFLTRHSVDVVFGAVVLGWFVHWYRISEDAWFVLDDWRLLMRAESVDGMFQAYNDHLSVVILVIYRLLSEMFGLETYRPYQVVGLLCLAAVSVAVYVHARRSVGPLLAGVVGVMLLWTHEMMVEVSVLNHHLSLVGGVVCAAALVRPSSRRTDLWLAAGLAFALASASGGVAVAAACVLAVLLDPSGRRRTLAIAGPILVWVAWKVLLGGHVGPHDMGNYPEIATALQVELFSVGLVGTFRRLAYDQLGLGLAILAALLIRLIWLVRNRASAPRDFASTAAWFAAVVVWWGGLVFSRRTQADPEVFRYGFVPMVYAVLALVPATPIGWNLSLRPWMVPRRLGPAAAAAFILMCVALVGAGLSASTSDSRERQRIHASRIDARATASAMLLGPEVVDDRAISSVNLYHLTGAEIRALFGRLPNDLPHDPEGVDLEVLPMVGLEIAEANGRGKECTGQPSRAAFEVPGPLPLKVEEKEMVWAGPGLPIVVDVVAESAGAEVEVRRFGKSWLDVGAVPAGDSAELRLPRITSLVPWEVRVSGGCIGEPTRG